MHLNSAEFIKGVAGTDDILEDGTSHVALIGRSNVGKSSIVNSLAGQKKLARTSAAPGLTREINVYRLNRTQYLLDLPGYGFVKESPEARERVGKFLNWYLFISPYTQKKVILVIDASVGLKESDREMLHALHAHGKRIVVVANKIDKIKKSRYASCMQSLREAVTPHTLIPYSAKKSIGVRELSDEVLGA